VTDARPDTGGLSGATPGEAVTWGKVDADKLVDTVTCYLDSTVALPLIAAYALAKRNPRPQRRLMDRLDGLMKQLESEYQNRRLKEEPVTSAPRAISFLISSISSQPTDRRISPSLMPCRSFSLGLT